MYRLWSRRSRGRGASFEVRVGGRLGFDKSFNVREPTWKSRKPRDRQTRRLRRDVGERP
jgi:hypothetical protein